METSFKCLTLKLTEKEHSDIKILAVKKRMSMKDLILLSIKKIQKAQEGKND